MLEKIEPRWSGLCIVAATGPSLTQEVADACAGHNAIAVNDAYRLMPFAPVMYACDAAWWKAHKGCPNFKGEKWSSHSDGVNKKLDVAKQFGLRLVNGQKQLGFSLDASRVHYGSNSGFQAVNLAILFGATRIVLVGFDMRQRGGKRHFFGEHKPPLLRTSGYRTFIHAFAVAAKMLPSHISIINATPESALKCFPYMPMDKALRSGD